MNVVDASVLVPALANDEAEGDKARSLVSNRLLVAPELIDVEVVSALRRLVRTGAVSVTRAHEALRDLPLSPIARSPHAPLVQRMWELRENVSAYDASYVALAEAMDAALITSDRRLASAPGLRCEVELIS